MSKLYLQNIIDDISFENLPANLKTEQKSLSAKAVATAGIPKIWIINSLSH